MEQRYRLVDCPHHGAGLPPSRRKCFHCASERRRSGRRQKVWCEWCGWSGVLQGMSACKACLGAGRLVVDGPSREAIRQKQLAIATPVLQRERQWQDNELIYRLSLRSTGRGD